MSTNSKIAKSAGLIGLGTVISRILGFIRDVVIAGFFGTAMYAQAFVVSFKIPNLLRDLVAEGAANSALVPVLSEHKTKHTDKEFWELVNSIFKIVSLVLIVIVGFGILASPLIVRIIAPGFIKEPEKLNTTITLTRILFPFLFFMGLVAFSTGVLNTSRHFAVPALSQGIVNIAMILSVALFYYRLAEPIYALAYGVLLGGFLQLCLQQIPLHNKGFRLKLGSLKIPPEAKKMGKLLIPRIMGACIHQLNVFIDTMLASLGGIVGAGGVAALYYSNRLIQFPLAIFGISLAQAALPTMSAQAARKDIGELRNTLSFSLRQAFLIMLPSCVGLMVLGKPIVRALFERGEFNSYSTQITDMALFYYSMGLFAYAGIKILTSCFYSMQDTKTPVKIAGFSLILNVILNLILMIPLKIGGLALATSITATVNFLILANILSKRLGGLDGARIAKAFMKMLFASIVMGLASLFIFNKLSMVINAAGTISQLLTLFVTVVLSVAVFFILCFVIRVEETNRLFKWILRKS